LLSGLVLKRYGSSKFLRRGLDPISGVFPCALIGHSGNRLQYTLYSLTARISKRITDALIPANEVG